MDPVLNPYAPGAGQPPPELAGRDTELAAFAVLLERLELGRPERGLILTGLRGVGKTVLLAHFHSLAGQRDWVVARVEAGSSRPFRLLASQALTTALRATSIRHRTSDRLKRALTVFKAFSLKAAPDGSLSIGIDVDPAAGRADTGDLELDLTELLTELAEAARDIGSGLALLIDEMQDLPTSDLAAVAAAAHHAGQQQLPIAIVGAGLPNLPVALTDAKSYAERLFTYTPIGGLTPQAARDALSRPAAELDVTWAPDALDHVAAAADGYPYFLQAYGKETWRAAPDSPITHDDATVGIATAQHELDTGFFGSRWERATPAQRHYLRALADTGHAEATTKDVAAAARKNPGELSMHRDQLIRKGLIYAPERGIIAFTVPGMADFIHRTTNR